MRLGGWAMLAITGAAACAGSAATRWWLAATDERQPVPACATQTTGRAPVPTTSDTPPGRHENAEPPTRSITAIPPAVFIPPVDAEALPSSEDSAARQADMNEQFQQGALDGPRSTALAQALASGEPSLPEGSSVDDVRCQGALCRIRARHSSPQNERAFIAALVQRSGLSSQRVTVFHPADDDGLSTVIYLGELPSDEP